MNFGMSDAYPVQPVIYIFRKIPPVSSKMVMSIAKKIMHSMFSTITAKNLLFRWLDKNKSRVEHYEHIICSYRLSFVPSVFPN